MSRHTEIKLFWGYEVKLDELVEHLRKLIQTDETWKKNWALTQKKSHLNRYEFKDDGEIQEFAWNEMGLEETMKALFDRKEYIVPMIGDCGEGRIFLPVGEVKTIFCDKGPHWDMTEVITLSKLEPPTDEALEKKWKKYGLEKKLTYQITTYWGY